MIDCVMSFDSRKTSFMEDEASPPLPLGIAPRPGGPEKVMLQFMAVGSAPLMKRNKFTVNGSDSLSVVYKFLRKTLRLKDTEALFVYCNSSFAPSPDQKLSYLYECFQVGEVLVLNYSLTHAWG